MENTQPKSVNKESLETLVGKGAHYGYSTSKSHPTMKKFIYGVKGNLEIIDLEKTLASLDEALAYVKELGKKDQQLFFIGAKAEAKRSIRQAAEEIEQPYVTERWIGGIFTNYSEIKKRIGRLEKLEAEDEKGEFSVYTKKEQLLLEREMTKLRTYYGGMRHLKGKPAAVFVVDPKQESIAVKEAMRENIPVVALMNSDCDESQASYPIPANDGSKETIEYITQKIKDAYAEGKKEGKEQ